MISMLCPSRNRPDSLRCSLDSLLENADEPDQVELLVAIDPDDSVTVEMLTGYDCPNSIVWVTSERFGYARLNEYYEGLYQRSSGERVVLWNDDAIMTTRGWDAEIEAMDPAILVGDLQNNLSPEFVCFPAVHRNAVEALGSYTLSSPHVDSLWQDVGRALGVVRPVDVYVQHNRPDLVGGPFDQTYLDGRAGLAHQHYFSTEFQAELSAATERVRNALLERS